jgi:hypothetical protein
MHIPPYIPTVKFAKGPHHPDPALDKVDLVFTAGTERAQEARKQGKTALAHHESEQAIRLSKNNPPKKKI